MELDKFYQRLENRAEKSEKQSLLCKSEIRMPELGCGDRVQIEFDKENGKTEEVFVRFANEDRKVFEKRGGNKEKQFGAIDIDECYKRKGKKKQKIREAMQNPLKGPRFTYEIEEKKQETLTVPFIEIPITKSAKKNPLSSLIKDQRDTSLSSLISLSRKKELKQQKNCFVAKKEKNGSPLK